MRRMNTILLLVGILMMFCVSCKRTDDCDAAIPSCSCAYLGIVDSEGNSLIGADNVYDPAEINLSGEGQQIVLTPEELGDLGVFLGFRYSDIISGADYLLQLNDTETDVLIFETRIIEGDCFDVKTLDRLLVNGNEIMAEGELYRIEK